MRKNDEFLTIQALGRSCVLGELYNAITNNFLSGFRLWNTADIEPTRMNANKSTILYREIKSFKDRADSLGISAALEASILSGAISIGGSGVYLSSNTETSESITIACVAQYITRTESLDATALIRKERAVSPDQLSRLRATHVVTAITYGGNVIGSLTQKSDKSSSARNISGKFSLDVFKSLGNVLGVGGNTDVSVEDEKKLEGYQLETSLVADFRMDKEQAVLTPSEMVCLFKKSGNLVGEGVPVEIVLAPLSVFLVDMPSFRDLAEADLLEITKLYNDILTLGNNRSWLVSEVDTRRNLFPTFHKECRNRNLTVSRLVQDARGELRSYLETYRAADPNARLPSYFRQEVETRFIDETSKWDKDLRTWKSLIERIRAAEQHAFTLTSIGDLGTKMNRGDKGYIAVIVIPENVKFATLMNTYRALADDIRTWRETLDKSKNGGNSSPAAGKTEFVSIYADPSLDSVLLELDDRTQSLANAIKAARKDVEPVFLTYGLSSDNLAEFRWNILNREGWGVITSREENWRYIGGVRRGVPHGSGIITYADQTKYTGGWVNGKRSGQGDLLSKEGKVVKSGIWVSNALAEDGLLAAITVYKDDTPVQYGEVALRSTDSVRSHVEKIGIAMGWAIGKRRRLEMNGARVRVNGSMIDPDEDPNIASTFWSLNTETKNIVITAFLER